MHAPRSYRHTGLLAFESADAISSLLSRVETPETIAVLTDADLAEIESQALDLFDAVRADDVEGVAHDDVERLASLRDAVQAVRTAAAERITAAVERQEAIDALDAEMRPTDETPDPDSTDDTGDDNGDEGDDAEAPTATAPDSPEGIDETADDNVGPDIPF